MHTIALRLTAKARTRRKVRKPKPPRWWFCLGWCVAATALAVQNALTGDWLVCVGFCMHLVGNYADLHSWPIDPEGPVPSRAESATRAGLVSVGLVLVLTGLFA